MICDNEFHVLVDEWFWKIGLFDDSVAKIGAVLRVILRIVEFHVRLAGRHEHVAHIHFRQFRYDFAVVLHL